MFLVYLLLVLFFCIVFNHILVNFLKLFF